MISVDYRSRTPLYQQLVDNIEDLAARGFLPPDSQLPSVRALAMELSINPNTIQRAYTELERRGIIYSLPGRGSFMSGSPESLLQAKRERLRAQITSLMREGIELGLSAEELLQTCRAAARITEISQKGSESHD